MIKFYYQFYGGSRTKIGALPMTSWKNFDVSEHKNTSQCRIEFCSHWISTLGVFIQRDVLKIQQNRQVSWIGTPKTGVIVLQHLPLIKFFWPAVELWPACTFVSFCRHFNFNLFFAPVCIFFSFRRQEYPLIGKLGVDLEVWPRFVILCWILTPGHNYDTRSWFKFE